MEVSGQHLVAKWTPDSVWTILRRWNSCTAGNSAARSISPYRPSYPDATIIIIMLSLQMVFVPLSTTGQFFAVSLGGAGVEARHGPLYLLPQLLREHRLPVRVHLMAGPLPTPLPAGFTGQRVSQSLLCFWRQIRESARSIV